MVLKNRNSNKNNIFKKINYPIILLTVISALFIGSFIYQVTSKTNDNNVWEVPAWAHNRWTNIKRDYNQENVTKILKLNYLNHNLKFYHHI